MKVTLLILSHRDVCYCLFYVISRNGHERVVRYLVGEAHCDPNVKNNAGVSPLHSACE